MIFRAVELRIFHPFMFHVRAKTFKNKQQSVAHKQTLVLTPEQEMPNNEMLLYRVLLLKNIHGVGKAEHEATNIFPFERFSSVVYKYRHDAKICRRSAFFPSVFPNHLSLHNDSTAEHTLSLVGLYE